MFNRTKPTAMDTQRPVYRDPNDLSGQVAVISGSTSGIGLALARAVAARGGDVVLNGLGDPAEIERTRAEMEASCGVRVRYHAANMLRGDEVADMVAFGKHQLPASSTSRPSRNSPPTSGKRSSRSICPRPSMRPGRRSRS
jgi:hypothetical protein